jgi:isochorismate synthase EntC
VIAHARGADGELLPIEVCAVELIKVLHPTVAVAAS